MKKEWYVSINEFCNQCWISRVTFYYNLKKIEKYLDCIYSTSFETIFWNDILNVRKFYKDSNKISTNKLKEWEVKKEIYYSITKSLELIWMSSTTFQKKLKDENFLNLFEKSFKIRKIKKINLNSIDKVMNYFYENSKMFHKKDNEKKLTLN